MRNGNSAGNGSVAKSVIAGALGGLVASWAMERFQRSLGQISPDMGGEPGGGGQQYRTPQQSEAPTYKGADAVAQTVSGQEVPSEDRPAAGALVHYAFGGAVGAIYGAAAARTPDVTAWGGVPFGATVWLIADEIGMPITGLATLPTQHPMSDHLATFAAHIIYGTTTECVRRTLVRFM